MNLPIKVLLPISIDRWRASIATQMRAVVEANPEIEFHSFSLPQTDEDHDEGQVFWSLPNVVRQDQKTALLERYDIVQLANLSAMSVGAAALAKVRGLGSTHVTSILCVEISKEDSYGWKYYQWARPVVDSFTGVSDVAGERARLDEPDRYCGVIHNGYCEKYFSPHTEADDALLPPELSKIKGKFPLWVSSIEDRKKPDVLISLAKRMPDVTFAACGYVLKNGGEGYLEEMLSLPNIVWLGLVERKVLRELYRSAAFLLFPSEREGLPLSVIEAMGMGLPTIAQAKSSLPELILPGVNGQLVDASDLDGWETHCRKMLDATGNGLASKSAIHQLASTKLTWYIAGRKYGEFYKLIMSGREREWLKREARI
jgi:glycosyltransferase involved in cell wall biosynthesis